VSLRTSLSDQSGAGTVLAASLLGVSVLTIALGQTAFSIAYAKMQNQSIADEIAIASSDSERGLSGGFACEVATSLANRNKVTLDECRIVGFDLFIRIHSNALGMAIEAKARAGPSR